MLHSLLQASVLNSLPTRTLYAVLNSMLSESADDAIGDDDKTMTAVSRVCAAQPEAFWLACERGCDTLFVLASARQEHSALLFRKISISSNQCRSISFYTNGVRLNEVLVIGADYLNPILATSQTKIHNP